MNKLIEDYLFNNTEDSIGFTGDLIECLIFAIEQVKIENSKHKKKFLLENYTVDIISTEDEKKLVREYLYINDNLDRFVVFNFIPKISKETFDHIGFPFQIGENGVYENGVAISLFYDVANKKLIKIVYNR